jgi:hypothetical protein
MTARAWLLALLLGASVAGARADDWQIVLLKPPNCSNCALLEESLKRRTQLQQVVLDGGAGDQVTAPIQRRNSVELSAQEWSELRALPDFDELLWLRQSAGSLQVLLKRDGVIVAAGDIADSADLRSARLPASITTPDERANPATVRNAHGQYLSDLYLRSWNLDWFYRLWRDPTIRRSRHDAWIDAGAGLPSPLLGKANVMLMSTASGASANEIFNAIRIEEIRDVLTQALAVDPSQLHVYYGGGNVRGANALEVRDRRIDLVRRDVAGASPFSPDAARGIFESIRAQPGSRNLLVFIGHGVPEGAGMWSSPVALSPASLRSLHERGGGDDVLVSGNCFGGVMARATSCGFFGARPDVVATGCQADAAEVAQSRDYLHMFFASLAPAAQGAADANGDDNISFAEAHWYASTAGDPRNVTYTSIDALADAWFDANAQALPRGLMVGDIRALAQDAPPAEARALERLLAGFDAGVMVPLVDLAQQAIRWRPDSGVPRALVAQLARRLLYLKSTRTEAGELAALQACENRSVGEFLDRG